MAMRRSAKLILVRKYVIACEYGSSFFGDFFASCFITHVPDSLVCCCCYYGCCCCYYGTFVLVVAMVGSSQPQLRGHCPCRNG